MMRMLPNNQQQSQTKKSYNKVCRGSRERCPLACVYPILMNGKEVLDDETGKLRSTI